MGNIVLENIFRDLGKRLTKENHLSDITWALANNIEEFRKLIMDLFKFEDTGKEPVDFNRENALKNGSRPDFLLELGDRYLVIENKIYDRNYHFEQYSEPREGKKKGTFGIIINHKMDGASRQMATSHNFLVVTWKDVVDQIKGTHFSSEARPYMNAYINYVREVCSIMEFKEIRLEKLNSLPYFVNLIKKIISEYESNDIEIDLYPAQRAFGPSWSGQYFSMKRKGSEKTTYPFWGIDYGEEPPCVLFALERDWCTDLYLKYKGKRIKKDIFYIETDAPEQEIEFVLNDEKFEEFKKGELDLQEEILKDFFQKVVAEIFQYL